MKRLGLCEGPCKEVKVIVSRGRCRKCLNRAFYEFYHKGVPLPGEKVNGAREASQPMPAKADADPKSSVGFIGTAHQPKAF